MPITYTPDTPKSTQPMNESQPEILNNFGAIKELIEINHVQFGSALQGCHNFLTMPDSAIPATPKATEINMFARTTSGANAPQIWIKYGTGVSQQFTGNQSAGSGTSGPGWCKYPSGIIMKWGTATVTQNTPGRFVFYPVGANIPAFTTEPGYLKVTPTQTGSGTFNTFGTQPGYGPDRFFLDPVITFPITINWFAIGI